MEPTDAMMPGDAAPPAEMPTDEAESGPAKTEICIRLLPDGKFSVYAEMGESDGMEASAMPGASPEGKVGESGEVLDSEEQALKMALKLMREHATKQGEAHAFKSGYQEMTQ